MLSCSLESPFQTFFFGLEKAYHSYEKTFSELYVSFMWTPTDRPFLLFFRTEEFDIWLFNRCLLTRKVLIVLSENKNVVPLLSSPIKVGSLRGVNHKIFQYHQSFRMLPVAIFWMQSAVISSSFSMIKIFMFRDFQRQSSKFTSLFDVWLRAIKRQFLFFCTMYCVVVTHLSKITHIVKNINQAVILQFRSQFYLKLLEHHKCLIRVQFLAEMGLCSMQNEGNISQTLQWFIMP